MSEFWQCVQLIRWSNNVMLLSIPQWSLSRQKTCFNIKHEVVKNFFTDIGRFDYTKKTSVGLVQQRKQMLESV